MALTYIPIATVKVGSGGAASIEFTSIPQTYTDLVVKLSARFNASTIGVATTFNNSTTNYSRRTVGQYQGSVSSSSTITTSIRTDLMVAYLDATANTFGSGELYIPNYAGSNYKSLSADGVAESNNTEYGVNLIAGLWSDASAITSIKLANSDGNNFVQHSSATLYGISKG